MSAEDAARSYGGEVAARLAGVLGPELVGVYLLGSLALGGYEPGRSDVDVAAFVARPLSAADKNAVAAAVRHEELPCPARKLELVVYRRGCAPAFELNLNTGAAQSLSVSFDPADLPRFWFVLDVAIARSSATALLGPPAAEIFPAQAHHAIDEAALEASRWLIANGGPPDDVVLNACRTRRFLDEGIWSSKVAAGAWAVARGGAAPVVEAAMALRRGKRAELTPETAAAFAASLLRPT